MRFLHDTSSLPGFVNTPATRDPAGDAAGAGPVLAARRVPIGRCDTHQILIPRFPDTVSNTEPRVATGSGTDYGHVRTI